MGRYRTVRWRRQRGQAEVPPWFAVLGVQLAPLSSGVAGLFYDGSGGAARSCPSQRRIHGNTSRSRAIATT